MGDQDHDHERHYQTRFRQLLLLQSALSSRQKKENRAVLTWTIRTQAEAERLRPWVDNMIFENFRPEKSFN